MFTLRLFLASFFCFALGACAARADGAADASVVAAVIVKPRDSLNAAQAVEAVRSALGAESGVRHVRQLSGGAQLLHLTAPATKAEVPRLIERLQASGRFEYVELDTMLRKP